MFGRRRLNSTGMEARVVAEIKKKMEHRERRRVPRVPVSFPVVVNWGRRQFRWLAREFSEYGILLAASNKELVGQELKLKLTLEGEEPPIDVEGIVAYSTETGVGIRFKNISPENAFSLRDYVQKRGIGITRK
jgi:hypothetical protein